MTKLIDKICFLRDLLENKQDEKLIYNHGVINSLIDEITRQAVKKARDYNHEIEFTAQDLRELAEDIRNTFKRWDYQVNPERLIKKFKGKTEIDLTEINNDMNKYLTIRTQNALPLLRLQGICEGHSVILYFLELDAEDETAQLTERLI